MCCGKTFAERTNMCRSDGVLLAYPGNKGLRREWWLKIGGALIVMESDLVYIEICHMLG